jgi:hypothetical protein
VKNRRIVIVVLLAALASSAGACIGPPTDPSPLPTVGRQE